MRNDFSPNVRICSIDERNALLIFGIYDAYIHVNVLNIYLFLYLLCLVDKNDPPVYAGELTTKAKALHLIRSIRLVTKSKFSSVLSHNSLLTKVIPLLQFH